MVGKIYRIPAGDNGGIKAFTFIKTKKGDYFLHKSSYNGDWNELNEMLVAGPVNVEFEGNSTNKGLRAENVSIVRN